MAEEPDAATAALIARMLAEEGGGGGAYYHDAVGSSGGDSSNDSDFSYGSKKKKKKTLAKKKPAPKKVADASDAPPAAKKAKAAKPPPPAKEEKRSNVDGGSAPRSSDGGDEDASDPRSATGRRKRKDAGAARRAPPRGWSVEEISLFERGLEEHGRDWKRVAEVVRTRDARAVASHAQKWLVRLAMRGEKVPRKVAETGGEGYTLSGKPLDASSATARAYGLKVSAVRRMIEVEGREMPGIMLPLPPSDDDDGGGGERKRTKGKGEASSSSPPVANDENDAGGAGAEGGGKKGEATTATVAATTATEAATAAVAVAPSAAPAAAASDEAATPSALLKKASPPPKAEAAATGAEAEPERQGEATATAAAAEEAAAAGPPSPAKRAEEGANGAAAPPPPPPPAPSPPKPRRRTEYALSRPRRAAPQRPGPVRLGATSESLELLACREFSECLEPGCGLPLAQPYALRVSREALSVMDLHAHLHREEIIGLLGGRWESGGGDEGEGTTPTVSVLRAFPCARAHGTGSSTSVELDPAAEVSARSAMLEAGLDPVGWYHSHPVFAPTPSRKDCENQRNYQALFKDSNNKSNVEPFVGAIVGPYDAALPSPAAVTSWFCVAAAATGGGGLASSSSSAELAPYSLRCKVGDRADASSASLREALLSVARSSRAEADAVDLSDRWRSFSFAAGGAPAGPPLTKGEKARLSLARHLADGADSEALLDEAFGLLGVPRAAGEGEVAAGEGEKEREAEAAAEEEEKEEERRAVAAAS